MIGFNPDFTPPKNEMPTIKNIFFRIRGLRIQIVCCRVYVCTMYIHPEIAFAEFATSSKNTEKRI